MSWGTVTLGRLQLSETHTLSDNVNANTGARALALAGQEMSFSSSVQSMRDRQEDVTSLMRRVVPVIFSDKSERNGFYEITDAGTSVTDWGEEGMFFTWNLALTMVGPANAVEIESRLSAVSRDQDYAITPEVWHAPAIGHHSYYVGTTLPGTLGRAGADGTLLVYRGVPVGVSPRWGTSEAGYSLGRVRVLNNTVERSGQGVLLSPLGWELNNGLVRVRPETSGTKTMTVSAYTGGAWRDKIWNLKAGGTTIEPTWIKSATILRNDYEMCSLRLMIQSPSSTGRLTLDLSLRRGSRYLEGYFQRYGSSTLSVVLNSSEAQVDNTSGGYVVASANDAQGDRFVVGSSKSVMANAGGGIDKSSTASLDFYLGVAAGGGSAVDGDAATDLRAQYLGSAAETTGVVPL